jgi:S1-C subfamily serine protease
VQHWCGADVRNIRDEGEMSVYGLPGVTGVLVLAVDPSSDLAKAGLKPNDVILGLKEAPINSVDDLLKPENAHVAGESFKIKISRDQVESTLISNP